MGEICAHQPEVDKLINLDLLPVNRFSFCQTDKIEPACVGETMQLGRQVSQIFPPNFDRACNPGCWTAEWTAAASKYTTSCWLTGCFNLPRSQLANAVQRCRSCGLLQPRRDGFDKTWQTVPRHVTQLLADWSRKYSSRPDWASRSLSVAGSSRLGRYWF